MSAPVTSAELSDVRHLVDHAIDRVLMAWEEDDLKAEPRLLMDALTNLACAREDLGSLLKRAKAAEDGSEIREMASALASSGRPQ